MAAEVKSEVNVAQETAKPSNLCCYSQRVCTLEKLKGFDFCHKHILEDKASPFKPCDFLAKSNGKRCNNPAPKLHDKGKSYCIIHTRKAELRRAVEQRQKRRQRHRQRTHEGEEIEEEEEEETHTPIKRPRPSSSRSNDGQQSRDDEDQDDDDDDERNSSDDDATIDFEVGGTLKVDSAWHGDVDSDAESVDSEEEDVLRHAGVWTMDEATRMCCDKMVRLKTLYMGQYKRLVHVLQEKRRKYYQAIQAEEEDEMGECTLSPSEILGPSNNKRRHGAETLLHKQAKEKRLGTSPRHHTSSQLRCTHCNQGVRCPDKVLPLTKYCIKHISHDPQQLLFQGCSFQSGDEEPCHNNIPKIYPHSTCRLHMILPEQPLRTDIDKDLQDAHERDRLRKEKEQELREAALQGELQVVPPSPVLQRGLLSAQIGGKEMPIPKALQAKSSALLPPPPPGQLPGKLELPASFSQAPSMLDSKSDISSKQGSDVEKMDIDPSEPSSSLASLKSAGSTPQEVSSPASVDSSPAGIQRISPTLLAASLVAVCSGAGVTAALPSVTSTSRSSDSTAGPAALVPTSSSYSMSSTSAAMVGASANTRTPSSSSQPTIDTYAPVNSAAVTSTEASRSIGNISGNQSTSSTKSSEPLVASSEDVRAPVSIAPETAVQQPFGAAAASPEAKKVSEAQKVSEAMTASTVSTQKISEAPAVSTGSTNKVSEATVTSIGNTQNISDASLDSTGSTQKMSDASPATVPAASKRSPAYDASLTEASRDSAITPLSPKPCPLDNTAPQDLSATDTDNSNTSRQEGAAQLQKL